VPFPSAHGSPGQRPRRFGERARRIAWGLLAAVATLLVGDVVGE